MALKQSANRLGVVYIVAWVLVSGLLLTLAACAPAAPEVVAIPTLAELPTLAPTNPPTDPPLPTDLPTATNTGTPIPATPSDTPVPPTASATVTETRPPLPTLGGRGNATVTPVLSGAPGGGLGTAVAGGVTGGASCSELEVATFFLTNLRTAEFIPANYADVDATQLLIVELRALDIPACVRPAMEILFAALAQFEQASTAIRAFDYTSATPALDQFEAGFNAFIDELIRLVPSRTVDLEETRRNLVVDVAQVRVVLQTNLPYSPENSNANLGVACARTCGQMTCSEANACLYLNPSLDEDGDGRPCEAQCGG